MSPSPSPEVASLRTEYRQRSLRKQDVDPDPMAQFGSWFDEALKAGVPEPNAMTLATASPEGRPSARIVLLKGFDERGLVFFTNYESRKGRELQLNPWAAVVFWWDELERQVRAEGRIHRVEPATSAEYFASRPRESQLGAWASPQSTPIENRDELESRFGEAAARFEGLDVERPPHWGGYRLEPFSVEFWQGRPSRLHDRIRYYRDEEMAWRIERLAP